MGVAGWRGGTPLTCASGGKKTLGPPLTSGIWLKQLTYLTGLSGSDLREFFSFLFRPIRRKCFGRVFGFARSSVPHLVQKAGNQNISTERVPEPPVQFRFTSHCNTENVFLGRKNCLFEHVSILEPVVPFVGFFVFLKIGQ